MPNRILKESICTSDSIDNLGWFEEVLFYRLIVNCDDYGRFDGRPAIIKNRLFPLKENLTAKTVAGAIEKLASAGLVTLYVFEGKPYLYLPTWNHHQVVRAKSSKYPAPENVIERMKSSEIICNQMQANAPVFENRESIIDNRESSVSAEPETASNQRRKDEGFEDFWNAYPRKVGKQAALKAWSKLRPSTELTKAILAAVEYQRTCPQWKKDGGQYIPNPATWLNQGRWEDDLSAPAKAGYAADADDAAFMAAMEGKRYER